MLRIAQHHLPERARARLLRGCLDRLTPNTIVDRDLLEAQLLEANVSGYAGTVEELEIGLNAVAAPIRDRSGAVVGAVSVSGPGYRLTRSRIREFGERARDTGMEISARLELADERTPRRGKAATIS